MNDFIDERRYAWRMIHAARRARAADMNTNGSSVCQEEIFGLLDQALDAGLDRAEIIVELADLGARLFALRNPDKAAAASRAVGSNVEADNVEICLN